jgi:hypothetical protein
MHIFVPKLAIDLELTHEKPLSIYNHPQLQEPNKIGSTPISPQSKWFLVAKQALANERLASLEILFERHQCACLPRNLIECSLSNKTLKFAQGNRMTKAFTPQPISI